MPYPVFEQSECILCGQCVEACPMGVIELSDSMVSAAMPDDCIVCGCCRDACPMGAITDIVDNDAW